MPIPTTHKRTFSLPTWNHSDQVELCFFGGLTEAEIVTAVQVLRETVKRDWRLAKSWLLRQLSEEVADAT